MESATSRSSQSSLPLQALIFFNFHYTAFFFLLNLCLLTYKAVNFYYPSSFLGLDMTTIFCYLIMDIVRLILASKGNKTSMVPPLTLSLVLAVGVIVLHAYYISLMTYILRVDLVINGIGLALTGLEFILSIIVIVNISAAEKKF
mmetsp:Transcript_22770/g.31215  ORF Transcript_22770/g.31215 Transcript_22770/m.31215 type:complete len:145 (+) Transcript_22770:26-460(+)